MAVDLLFSLAADLSRAEASHLSAPFVELHWRWAGDLTAGDAVRTACGLYVTPSEVTTLPDHLSCADCRRLFGEFDAMEF